MLLDIVLFYRLLEKYFEYREKYFMIVSFNIEEEFRESLEFEIYVMGYFFCIWGVFLIVCRMI